MNKKENYNEFTIQFSEMDEIINLGFMNNDPIISEGIPGQGKQLYINFIIELLGYEIANTVISISKEVESLLEKNILTNGKNKNIKILKYLLNETKLLKAIKR